MDPTQQLLLSKFNKAHLILILLTLIVLPNSLQALPGFAHGWVYSRGTVTNDLGQYTWSRYDTSTGKYLGDIGVADDSLSQAEWRVMSGDEYRNIIKQKANLHSAQEDLEFLSRADYESTSLLLANGQPMTKPPLSSTTAYVSILPQLRRLIDDPQSLILAEYPVNPDVAVADNIVSILHKYRGDNIGAIRLQSTDRIGFKVAFAKDANGNSDPSNDTLNFGLDGTLPVSPLTNIGIDSVLRGGGMTDDKGHFSAIWYYPPCPMIPFNYSNLLTANLYYIRFNPRSGSRLNTSYMATRTVYDACIPELFYIPIIGPWPLSSGRIDPHFEPLPFTIDLSYLSGVAYLTDDVSVVNNRVQLKGNKVQVTAKSQYLAEDPDHTAITAQYYDFDRDEAIDTVLSGHLEDKPVDEGEDECDAKGKTQKFVAGDPKDLQGVWLSSNEHSPVDCQPDFTRIIDYESYKNKNHQGLLSEISAEDLRNTDIYIVRLSDGKLIAERIGLNESERNRLDLGEDRENSRFFYTVGMYGNLRGGFRSERFLGYDEWQARQGLNPDLHSREADHVKPGDVLRIFAINRATGYIGHVDTIHEIFSNGALLGSKIDPIIMGPPNLRIKVERDYKIDKGVSAAKDTITQLIGFEGASLTSDKLVAITTEWLDHEGHPMPESLKDAGYTGRVAILSGNKTLPGNSQGVYQFAIKPGKNLQVIQLPNALTDKEHFYIHVSGEPKSGQAIFAGSTNNSRQGKIDFKSTGQNPGILENRPDHYVPFLVPVYDEESTELQMQAYRLLKITDPEKYKDAPDSIYRWVYRPEMQFTSYDLKIDKINKSVDTDGNGTIEANETIDILNENIPVITSGSVIDILYNLSTTDLLPLDYFNAGTSKDLIFKIGEQEVKATMGEDQEITFDDLTHLNLLQPDDFLSISLYANNDMGNVLWQFAFESIFIESTTIGYNNQTENIYYITADDPEVKLKAGIIGYAYRSPEDQYPGTMKWKVNGSGNFIVANQNENEFGLFDNTLTMPRIKGAKGEVSVVWNGLGGSTGNNPVIWKTVEVLAGKPTRIEVSDSGQAVALDQGDIRLDFDIYDAYNNLVEDGTEIELKFTDSLLLKDQQLSTIDGKVYVVFAGGEYAVDDTVVTVTSGSAIKETHINVAPLDIVLTAGKTNLNKTETTNVTATVTKPDGSPASGIPVTLSAAKGIFAEQALITDGQGNVSTTFTAGLNKVNDSWIAMAGYAGATEVAYSVQSAGSHSIDAEDAVLVADTTTAGTLNYDSYGIPVSIAYEIQGTISTRGNIGDTVSIGDMADPNLEPLLSLPLNDIEYEGLQGRFIDDHDVNNAYINRGQPSDPDDDIIIVNDHPLGAGHSAHFKINSRVTLEQNSLLNISDNSGFRLDIKPLGNGDIASFDKQGLKLSYNSGTLTLRAVTSDGPFSVNASGVDLGQWHRVAANIQGSVLNLYVDGVEFSTTISGTPTQGNPMIISSKVVEIGGLEARIRDFRVYNYASAPLISFADDSISSTLQASQETLTIKSLGNLGIAVTDSQLKGIRVALINGNERNYASLLTQRGFQAIAQQYLYSVSPQVPVANLVNPLPGLVQTAYAWSWEGVWEGVKETAGFLIPYQDFIIIGQQMMYFIDQDWEHFDPAALAFASLGAATIIPVAKPLKAVLGPLKKVVDGMKRFPAARHFAGAVGTAVKAAISGKTDKIVNLLPFLLIAIELYDDPEVFEFIMNAIESEDDLWVWVEYIALFVSNEGGLDDLAYVNSLDNEKIQIVSNPIGFMVPEALATPRREVAQLIIKTVKKISKSVDIDPKKITKVLSPTLKAVKSGDLSLKKLISSGDAIRYLAINGAAKTRNFIKNSKKWRINRWFVLFALGYVIEEHESGRLKLGSDEIFYTLFADIFSPREWIRNGALFQLSQVVFFHIENQYGQGPAVKGIEQVRPAYTLVKGKRPSGAEPYKRRIDIVLEGDNDTERWIETKSLIGPFKESWFKNTLKAKSNKDTEDSRTFRGYFRQYFQDMRLNNDFINDANQGEILVDSGNSKYNWYFHDYSNKKGVPPTSEDITRTRKWLCKVPNVENRVDYYKHNLSGTSGEIRSKCAVNAVDAIQKRDTKSYISDLLRPYAAQLGIEDFVAIIETLDP